MNELHDFRKKCWVLQHELVGVGIGTVHVLLEDAQMLSEQGKHTEADLKIERAASHLWGTFRPMDWPNV
jgi:hypothetical protein